MENMEMAHTMDNSLGHNQSHNTQNNLSYEVPVNVELTNMSDLNKNVTVKPENGKLPNAQNHRVSKKDKKREAIDGQAREIIFKVIKFFESEKRNRGYAYPVENVMKRASAATGLSESTIKRIKRDGYKAEATNTKMAGPKKKRVRRTKVQLDYYQLCALRGIVNSYATRKEVPTLSKILSQAKNELDYRGGKESLRLILLNKLGIKFKKCEKKNKKPPEPTVQNAAPPPQHPPPIIQNNMVMLPPTSIQNNLMHPQMNQMKPPDNQCLYGSVMPQLIGL